MMKTHRFDDFIESLIHLNKLKIEPVGFHKTLGQSKLRKDIFSPKTKEWDFLFMIFFKNKLEKLFSDSVSVLVSVNITKLKFSNVGYKNIGFQSTFLY